MQLDSTRRYKIAIEDMLARLPLDEAMTSAVGGDYDVVGTVKTDLLELCGLCESDFLVDIGCGSGRLAKQLGKRLPNLRYLGTDVVQSLLDYATRQCPAAYKFQLQHDLTIPIPDDTADYIVAFSVFTHLLYEHSFTYLRDMRRAVRPGGIIIFSFIEMAIHWNIFEWALTQHENPNVPFNIFIERSTVETWAAKLDLAVDRYIPMGQTAAVLRRPLG
jgi:ubiquinone/menaquinone biosynthesis C-methylase UbiE